MNNINKKLLREFKGKKILITGGTGSIGINIAKDLLKYSPNSIRILSNDENSIVESRKILNNNSSCTFFVGDIRDKDRLNLALRGVDIVFHAGAMIHVDVCEQNPFDAVKTNVVGTSNILEASLLENVSKFILISTDKATNPTSTLGASKLLAERLTINAGTYRGTGKTIFAIVRFGNVLGSRGSVLQVFREQLRLGKNLTVTDSRMTRFMMSIEDSVKMILKVTVICKDGEIFILKMPSVRIETLAREMSKIFMKKNKIKKNIAIKIGTSREGEKFHETLISENELDFCYKVDGMYKISKTKTKKKIPIKEFNSETSNRITKENLLKLIDNYFKKNY